MRFCVMLVLVQFFCVERIEAHIQPAFRYHKILYSICGPELVILHKRLDIVKVLKCSNSDQEVGNLIEEFQSAFEIVR